MRLRVNECAVRLWDEWTMRLGKMSECTMRFMRGMDDAFKKMYDAFKSEWMYDAFMEWMDDAFMCVFFFFLSLCGCCGCVDMKCHAPMRPIFTAQ